jgi:hypothetical protein
MARKTSGDPVIDALYTVRKGKVEFIDVPELAFVMIDGSGAPAATAFSDAIQALYSVSYGAHFALKKASGAAPRVMALEALWWVEGTAEAWTMDRDQWRWRAMIMQLPPLDRANIEQAIVDAKRKKDLAALDELRFERWEEGRSAQIMHIGPYATESTSIAALHEAIADNGYRPRGAHHEIYLGDPRTAAPENLRTILRQPIEPAG